jgi:hypothetical protein
MQFHPESSTSVDAPFYVDELANIRNIAFSMPFDMMLYVKDHRHVASGRHPLAFYDEVARIPNVLLIDPGVDSKRLVASSEGVIAGTSTMGFEAIVLGKPVFVLGNPFYEFHPLCVKIESYKRAFEAFCRASEVRVSSDDALDFIGAYYMCTFPGTYDLKINSTNDELARTAASIIEAPPVAGADVGG